MSPCRTSTFRSPCSATRSRAIDTERSLNFALTYLKANPGKLVELSHLLSHDSLETTAIYTQPAAEELAEDLENSPLNAYGQLRSAGAFPSFPSRRRPP